jgi:hypothetical protein
LKGFPVFAPVPNPDDDDFIVPDRIAQPVTRLTEGDEQVPHLWPVDVRNGAADQGVIGEPADGFPNPVRGSLCGGWIVNADEVSKTNQVLQRFG